MGALLHPVTSYAQSLQTGAEFTSDTQHNSADRRGFIKIAVTIGIPKSAPRWPKSRIPLRFTFENLSREIIDTCSFDPIASVGTIPARDAVA